MTPRTDEELLDLLADAARHPDPTRDIDKHGDLTLADAYRLQLAWKQRRASAGDPVVGYRVSMSSRSGIEESIRLGLLPEDVDPATIEPVFTTLSLSNLGSEGTTIELPPDRFGYVEAEVGVVIGSRLAGPHVTISSAMAAVGGFFPAIDQARIPKTKAYGLVHTIATAATPQDTTIVCGTKVTPPSINLPVEGILVSVNGKPRASATAWECLGNPLNAVVWLANTLAEFGVALEPGQLVITGVCPHPQRLAPGDITAQADFTTLGSVTALVAVAE